MKLWGIVLALTFSACGVGPNLGSSTREASNIYLKYDTIEGESTQQDPRGVMIKIDFENGIGQMITSCQDIYCRVADVGIARPSPNPEFVGGWIVTVPGNPRWRGELIVRKSNDGTDSFQVGRVNLVNLTGDDNLDGGDVWYPVAPIEEVRCFSPCDDAPDGFICVPTCSLCDPLSKGCF